MSAKGERRVLRRIHIIGGPGSGKSTLARQLGNCLQVPVYELDKVAFQGRDFNERPLELRLADVRQIAQQRSWIAEGIFLGWTEELLRAADAIIWLDFLPWRVAAWRIVVRSARWGLEEARNQRGFKKFTRFGDYARNLRLLADTLRSSRKYYEPGTSDASNGNSHWNASSTARALVPYSDKVVHCRSTRDLRVFLDGLAEQTQQVTAVTQ